MSLINRESLLSFEKMDADLCATCGYHHTAEDVIMMIKTAPTVDDVAQVHHGRVVTVTDRWKMMHQECSECGETLAWKAYPNYCPNCGAKMDLEVN